MLGRQRLDGGDSRQRWEGLTGKAAWAGESQHVSVFEAESALQFIASSRFWCAGDSRLCR